MPSDPEQLARYFDFTDFGHFIEVYLSVVDLLRTPEDIWTLTHDVAHDLAAQNVRYAELTLTPYTSIRAGIAAEAFCEAVEDARRTAEDELDLTLRWCFDIPGEFGLEGADATIDTALRLRPDGLVSFGLGGPEAGVPRRSSRRTSPRRMPPGCTASRTRGSPPGRRRSGTRCATSAPSGSGTASRPRRTRS